MSINMRAPPNFSLAFGTLSPNPGRGSSADYPSCLDQGRAWGRQSDGLVEAIQVSLKNRMESHGD